MIDLDFSGFASQPGNALCECLDAAGIDASVGQRDQPGVEDVFAPWDGVDAGVACE